LFDYVAAELAHGALTFAALDAYKRDVYLSLFASVCLLPGVEQFARAARRNFDRLGLAPPPRTGATSGWRRTSITCAHGSTPSSPRKTRSTTSRTPSPI
jgi:hypothetical protein